MAELNQSSATPGGKRRARKLTARVDLTAMVDLAFLLVTFFILTTRLQKDRQMPLTMPVEGPSGPVAESRTLTLCLGAKDQVLWYRGLVQHPLNGPQVVNYNPNGLRHAIMAMTQQVKHDTGKDLIVVVKPAEHSSYGNLVNAMDELNITKSERYAVADIAKEDIALLKSKNAY